MRLFNKVAVIGTGLIGGSLALSLKKQKLANTIVGVSKHANSLKLALRRKAIDRAGLSLDIIKGSDLVILATPVSTIINLKNKIRRLIEKDCIVIDVGSTKQKIVTSLEKVFPGFLGCHPLAGSEKRGISNAKADIFKDSLCIITPTKNTSKDTIKKINKLWVKVGARVVFLSPKEHDRILSFTSHLPHIIAFTLINSIPQGYLRFSSGGLKDATRIASSDPGLWQDIFLSNQENILKAIDLFEKNIKKLKSAIRERNSGLNKILNSAKSKRDSLE